MSENDASCGPVLPDRPAFFLDFDGTLVEIAPSPSQVKVATGLTQLIARLADAHGGAVAVVSGRPIAEIDGFLAPLRLPAAGLHGLEWRTAPGEAKVQMPPLPSLTALRDDLDELAGRFEGVALEDKGAAIAIHYRAAPRAEEPLKQAVGALTHYLCELAVLHGKMVIEIKPAAASKATAVERFMTAPPFEGRTAVFVGDDTTDEDGFRVAAALGGLGVKVGAGHTLASHRLADVAAVHRWLSLSASADGRREGEPA